jgi:arabinofuranosyltransferase
MQTGGPQQLADGARPAVVAEPQTVIEARPVVADSTTPPRWLVPLLSITAMALAWSIRFVQDDAYISFRYARNLADGHGLVFQQGDKVQGFTNPLWTVLLAIPHLLGRDPALFSEVVGIACLGGTVAVTFTLAMSLLGTTRRAVAAVAVLVGCVTFVAYGTGGLETSLQTLLVTSVALLALTRAGRGESNLSTLLAISVLSGLAMLTRLDSAVLVVPWSVVAWVAVDRRVRGRGWRIRAGHVLAVLLPAAVLVIAWLGWASAYYGSPFPNTLKAKSGGLVSLRFGAEFVLLFVLSYGLPVLIPAIVLRGRALVGSTRWRIVVAVIGLWVVYVVVAGGDFMEFRFMVPVMPHLACVIAFIVLAVGRAHRTVLVVVLLAFSLLHLHRSWSWVSGFDGLREQVHGANGQPGWIEIGHRLHVLFPGGPAAHDQVILAMGAAGVVPYESDLPTIDTMGLNDRWVAEHGIRVNIRPGHLVRAPMSYLARRRVNLLLETPPFFVRTGANRTYGDQILRKMSRGEITSRSELPPTAKIFELPMNDSESLVIVLLRDNPRIDAAVRAGEARVVPLH